MTVSRRGGILLYACFRNAHSATPHANNLNTPQVLISGETSVGRQRAQRCCEALFGVTFAPAFE